MVPERRVVTTKTPVMVAGKPGMAVMQPVVALKYMAVVMHGVEVDEGVAVKEVRPVVESVSANELPAMEPMGADMEPDPAVDAVGRAKTHPAMRAGANSRKNAAGGFGYSGRRFMSNWRFSNSPCTASKNSTPLR